MTTFLETRDYRQFRVVPRTPVIGGWIEGCNLAELDDAGLADLCDALWHYGVLFGRKQNLSFDAMKRVALAFGDQLLDAAGRMHGMAMLLQRVSLGADAFTPRQALALATKGGARTLGWNECGILAPDMRADIAIWDLNTLQNAGAWDPVAALVLCAPHRVRDLVVEGRRVVKDGEMVNVDVHALQEKARAVVQRLMS